MFAALKRLFNSGAKPQTENKPKVEKPKGLTNEDRERIFAEKTIKFVDKLEKKMLANIEENGLTYEYKFGRVITDWEQYVISQILANRGYSTDWYHVSLRWGNGEPYDSFVKITYRKKLA